MLNLLMLAAATVATPPPLAQTEPRTITTVRVSDLNLTTTAGITQLDHRILRAARWVCPDEWNGDLARRMAARHCVRQAIAAVAGQRARAVTAAANGRRAGAVSVAAYTSSAD